MTPLNGKPIIGLTGGIGSGKSLVASQLKELGCGVVDADQLARQALDAPEVRRQLVDWWGPGVLNADGRVDRRAVGRIVFNDERERRRLESVIHPEVGRQRKRLHEGYAADAQVSAIVEDCPLLIETGLDAACDHVIFVDAPRALRLERVADRGWDQAELARREAAQLPLDTKAQRADDVIVNASDPQACLEQVRRVLSRILQESA